MSDTPTEVRVCNVSDLTAVPMKRFDVWGRGVLISRVGGEYFATADLCSHQEVLLDRGELEGTILTCPGHGARFDVTTGAAKGLPAVRPIASYPVTVRGGELFILLRRQEGGESR